MLSLIEDISIDFPSHFILSLIDVFKDTATRDKLIFLSAIMRLFHHFSVSFLESPYFPVMCVIDAATIRQNEAQLKLRRPQIETMTPPVSTAPSSSAGGVTFKAIMAQLVHMNARLDTLSDELCHVNTYVGRNARRQAVMGGFTVASSPSPPASKDESDDGTDNDDADEDDGASLPGDNEMST